jgi:NifU-like protein involved in Fe-S cluster formation
MIYNELTRAHFERPDAAGELEGAGTVRAAAGDRAQGTWVQFDVRVEAGLVQAVRFRAFGCPHVIAACDVTAAEAVGHAARAALPVGVQVLRERLDAPVAKLGRLLVLEDAWLAAMRAALRGS